MSSGLSFRRKLLLRLEKARKEHSVVAVNENALSEAEEKRAGDDDGELFCFGVKDSDRFPMEIFRSARNHQDFLWLTVDRMADKGRSIDTGLVNPLTYRPMTGSTSGGAVNVLLGIDDFVLGTDGGGSVLAPALACQLPSFIGAGLGLYVDGEPGTSTDGLSVRPSVGVIGKSVGMLEKVSAVLLGKELPRLPDEFRPRVAIPRPGCLETPTGADMAESLVPFIKQLRGLYFFEAVDMSGAEERKTGIDICRSCFDLGFDLILTYEGPVDVLGYGETIPAAFGGVGPKLAERGGKYLLKAANPAGATALTVPSQELASGFVLLAPPGLRSAAAAFGAARALAELAVLPEVFVRYFLTAERLQGGFKLER